MNPIIERYKKIRKKGILEKKFKEKYAFVGIGNHAINNLYPVLHYLNVDLKYIVVKSEETKKLVQNNFTNVIATTNLQEVLKDETIKGVFISATPSAHFTLTKQIIKANKNAFVEKPPCLSLSELKELIALNNKAEILIGLQRRYAPVYNILANKVKNTSYYTLKYKTGAYPEGDELLDLFIHPLDAVFYLFGAGNLKNIKVIKSKNTISYLAQVIHNNGIFGSIEFSTDYSWTTAQDILTINTPKGEFITENTSKLIFKDKPKVLINIPLEKVKPFYPQTKTLYQQNNFLPVKEHNQLYTAGYFSELTTFLKLCENSNATNNSSPKDLTSTFEAIEQLKNVQ